ncbi:Protein kinase [Phytophthora megakarya]|uniref:Protein kinase n=1 Tax=Phytophthora megakarya TaxID=4795 RepID=A0A225V744_9STRA|nr:Protein kinase [Phytophthora megakarya]
MKRMFHNILHRNVIFTQTFSDEAKDLLTTLLYRDSEKQLGPGGPSDLGHPFFARIDMLMREMEPTPSLL